MPQKLPKKRQKAQKRRIAEFIMQHYDRAAYMTAHRLGETCGVSLTESSLMVPIKSVSGIIGLGPQVRHLDYTCGLCDFKQCYKRKQRIRKSSE